MATPKDDWIGFTLRGQRGSYTVRAVLGAGGMATVYLGVDAQGREVAIKVPKEQVLREEGFANRFKREIGSLIKLAHRNVLKVLDIGDIDGIPFAVLQYLALGSLRLQQPLDISDGRVWPMGPDEVAGWLEAIAEALDYVYQQGYVHRDVKPENIMFDAEGNAYLGDFGVIKARADIHRDTPETVATGAGLVLGTPHYMAPEVLMGEPYDGRADQYSLAVTVYELLAARLPFPGDAPKAIVGHTSKQPPPMAQFVQNLPPAVERVVLKGLAKQKEDRYPNCRAFAKAFIAAIPVAPTVSAVANSGSSSQSPWYEAAPKNEPQPTPRNAPPPVPRMPPPVPARTPGAVPVAIKTRTIICPYCDHRTNVPENVRSKAIRCGSCHKVYFLETPAALGRSDAPTRQDQQATRETRSEERRPRDERRSKKATPATKKAATDSTDTGPSLGEIIRFVFRWTMTAVVVFGMLAGAYFGYFAFIEYRAKQACKDSERYCDQSEFVKAHDAAERGIDADKDFALSYVRRGRAKYMMLDYDGALADYKKAIELDSQLGLAYAYRSIANYEEGYVEEAMDDADRATRLLKESGVAHGYRGLILSLRTSQMSEAISETNKAVGFDNKSPHPLIARAYLHDKQGKLNEAEGDVRAVATMQGAGAYPLAISAHFYLQRAMPALLGQRSPITPAHLDLAKKHALDAVKTDANSVWGHYALAEYYLLSLQEKEARDEVQTVLRLAPNAARGYELLAIIECEFGSKYTDAIAAIGRGIERLPNSARLHAGRAKLYLRTDNPKAALADADKAIQVNPRNARYFDLRGQVHRALGEYGAAATDESKAREIRDFQR